MSAVLHAAGLTKFYGRERGVVDLDFEVSYRLAEAGAAVRVADLDRAGAEQAGSRAQ